MKIKEKEKINKYLDFARGLKKLWNLMVIAITIVVGVLGTVIKCLEKRAEELKTRGRIETIQTI